MVYKALIVSVVALLSFVLAAQPGRAASTPMRVTVHVPSKSLSIMPYYFGKDKGFCGRINKLNFSTLRFEGEKIFIRSRYAKHITKGTKNNVRFFSNLHDVI